MPVIRTLLSGLLLTGLCVGCAKHSSSETTAANNTALSAEPPEAPPDPALEAKQLFNTKCVVCHGDHGAGDGPGAAALNPKPRAFADAAWQASATDEHIKKTILEGGAAVGKSAAMPSNPDLTSKPQELDELVKIVRSFKH